MTPRVELVALDAATLRSLAEGDLAAANRTAPVTLTPYLAGPECQGVWRIRARQVVEDPPSAAWVTRIVWDPDRGAAVGRAGYHGPPDEHGMVEVGYSVDPDLRRRGYARAAMQVLLDRAIAHPDVRVLRATISPDNEPSLNLIASFGLERNGEQWDEEDGLEWIYEIPTPTPASG